MKNYNYGRGKEQLVAQRLRNKGASVNVSPGSKGAADLVADFGSRKWYVQVKSTRAGTAAMPSGMDAGRLKQMATKGRGAAVVAQVTGSEVTYRSARDGRKLKP